MVWGPEVSEGDEAPGWVRKIEAVIERVGQTVAWLGLAMVIVTALVVFMRYVLGVGSVALQESVAYMHAALFMIGASYAVTHDAHVRVDVFYRGWSPRRRALVDLAGTLLFLIPFCGFIIWVSYGYVARSIAVWEGSPEAGGLPGVFLLKGLIPLMATLVALAGLARLGRSVHTLRRSS